MEVPLESEHKLPQVLRRHPVTGLPSDEAAQCCPCDLPAPLCCSLGLPEPRCPRSRAGQHDHQEVSECRKPGEGVVSEQGTRKERGREK